MAYLQLHYSRYEFLARQLQTVCTLDFQLVLKENS
jgi:hypothetical protein